MKDFIAGIGEINVIAYLIYVYKLNFIKTF